MSSVSCSEQSLVQRGHYCTLSSRVPNTSLLLEKRSRRKAYEILANQYLNRWQEIFGFSEMDLDTL